jgi:hypothetical protein
MPTIQRGRKSVAALLVADVAGAVQYPDAPYDLTDDEAEEWRAIVRSMQPDYFARGNFPILTQLCRHICSARRLAQLTARCMKAKDFDQKQYNYLMKAQRAESAVIQRLSRALRLTQQAKLDRNSPKLRPKVAVKNPWDEEE